MPTYEPKSYKLQDIAMRVINIDGAPWFFLDDVMKGLAAEHWPTSNTLKHVHDEDKRVEAVRLPLATGTVNVVSYRGLADILVATGFGSALGAISTWAEAIKLECEAEYASQKPKTVAAFLDLEGLTEEQENQLVLHVITRLQGKVEQLTTVGKVARAAAPLAALMVDTPTPVTKLTPTPPKRRRRQVKHSPKYYERADRQQSKVDETEVISIREYGRALKNRAAAEGKKVDLTTIRIPLEKAGFLRRNATTNLYEVTEPYQHLFVIMIDPSHPKLWHDVFMTKEGVKEVDKLYEDGKLFS